LFSFFHRHPMLRLKIYTLVTLLLVTIVPWTATALNRADGAKVLQEGAKAASTTEELMVKSLMAISAGDIQKALDTLDQILANTPNFKLAQMVKGDLLMARGLQFQNFGTPNPGSEDVAGYRDEARKRIERYLAKDTHSYIPEPVWQLDENQPYIFVVDADKSRLFVYRNDNGTLQYNADFYVTIGKNGGEKKYAGDKRTPLGVYYTAPRLTQKLADMYGDAAYPLSYPNEWDKRQGKTGSGIWLHGTSHDTYSRPPQSSDGCVVLGNQDLNTLTPILQQGSVPVIIAKDIEWLKPNSSVFSSNAQDKQALLDAIENWRKDWQSQETEIYLEHYSNNFSNGSLDYNHWAEEKKRIQASKPRVDIKLSNLSVLRYPNSAAPMAVVTFDQTFRSSVLDSQMRKRQYWIFENDRWKIIYEGAA
jgi:murein L,D-transpeptidase YafK